MKRGWMVAVALAVSGAAWLLWPKEGPPKAAPEAVSLPSSPSDALERGARAEGLPGEALTGQVVDPSGRPVEGAEVLLAESAASMADLACECPTCHKRLLEDGCNAAAAKVALLVSRREGEWLPERAARSDATGAVAFPGAPRRPHTVWARAEGFAPGFRQGVLPGQSVVLELAPSFGVSGHVVDESGLPIAQALVTAVPTLLPRFVETTTDAQGAFRLGGLGPGAHYLTALAPGFLPSGHPLPHPGPPEVTLTLPRPRSLEGRVTDRAGAARGASIRLYSEHGSLGLSATDGSFRADNLFPGTYTVSASRGRRSAHKEIALGPGVTRVELSLEDALLVRGRVLDEAGAPLAAAALTATMATRRLLDARSGPDGRFALDGVPPGAKVTASLPGYEPSSARAGDDGELELVLRALTYVTGVVLTGADLPAPDVQVVARGAGRSAATSDAAGTFRIALHAPGPVTLMAHHSSHGSGEVSVEAPAADVRLRLAPLGALRARLVDRQKHPIAGGFATAWRQRSTGDGRSETLSSDSPSRDDGVLVLAGLAQGSYQARFTAPGYQSAERADVAVPRSGEIDLGEVMLEAGLEIRGVVLQQDGSPAAGAFVHARTRGSRGADGVETGYDGAFALKGLKEGSHVVSAFLDKSAVEAPARAGDTGVVLRMRAPSRLRGRVLDEASRPLSKFFVDGEAMESTDGRFEVPARAVREQIFFRVGAPGRLTEFRQAKVGEGGAADAGDIALRRSLTVEGTVQDEKGAPVAGAMVSVADRDDARARDDAAPQAISRSDGRFRLEGLSSGPTTLVGRKAAAVGEAELDLSPGAERSDAVLTLRAQGAIEGVLRSVDGRPLTGEVQAGGVTAPTDAQGRYRLEGVVPGPTTVLAFLENDASATRQVTVEAGQTTHLDIDLAVGSTLRISVLGQLTGAVHVLQVDGVGSAAASGLAGSQTAEVVRGAGVVTGLPGGQYRVLFANEHWVAEGGVDVPTQGSASVALTPRPLQETRILPP